MNDDKVLFIKDKKGEKNGLIKDRFEVNTETDEIIAAPNGGFVAVGEEVIS